MVEVMKLKEILLLAGVLALDMLTKFWVQSTMTLGQSIPVIRGFFNITYAQNTGAAWVRISAELTPAAPAETPGAPWITKS